MSKSISIHDTHRIPYFNAELTAVQEGTTTPIKFVDYDGNELGYKVYSNARGFLCDSTGTLYTSGVFVGGNAEIKCTLKDGKSTTWVVGEDNKEAINDGQVLTKSGIKLFSANSNSNWVLSVQDIEDMPPLNKWKESQQIVAVESPYDTVDVDEFTKVLIVVCLDTTPFSDLGNYTNQFTLVLNPASQRFGQRLCVWNLTGWRLSLKNAIDAIPFATVDPVDGRTSLTLVNFNNLTQWKYILDADYVQMNAMDSVLHLSSYVAASGFDVSITDRTPELLYMDYTSTGLTTDNDGVLIKLSVSLSFERRIKFVITDNNGPLGLGVRNGKLYFLDSNNNVFVIGTFRTGEIFEVYFPAGTNTTVGYAPIALYGIDTGMLHSFKWTASHNGVVVVPPKCDEVEINIPADATLLTVQFPSEKNEPKLIIHRTGTIVSPLVLTIKTPNYTNTITQSISIADWYRPVHLVGGFCWIPDPVTELP